MHLLRSYRWRRRLVVSALVAAIAGPLIYLGVHFSTTGESSEASQPHGPTVANPAQPKRAPFRRPDRRAVHRLLKQFISTAVVRRHVARSWDLVSSSLKQGVTRKEWNRGQIPVIPYPAASRGLGSWSYVEYSYRKAVGLEVYVFPKPGSGWSAMSADVEVVKGADDRWRVSYWMPKKYHGPPAAAKATKEKTERARTTIKHAAKRHAPKPARSAEPAPVEPVKAGRTWWALPIGILALVVVLPISIGVFVWIRNRRARAEYARLRRP